LVVWSTHTTAVPVIAPTTGFTVTVVVTRQVVGNWYVIIAVPVAVPVTMPVDVPNVISVAVVDHVPPPIRSVSARV